MKFWIVRLPIAERSADLFSDALGDAISVSEVRQPDDSWQLEALYQVKPEEAVLSARVALAAAAAALPEPSLTVEPLADTDWLSHVYAGFPPLQVGRLFVHGSHDAARVPPGALAVRIDAATAFGSGQHESTHGCLIALGRLAKGRRFTHVLDMGCGSGILGIAAAKLWRARVAAVDIDPESTRVTVENARLNGVGRLISAQAGKGYRTTLARDNAPYDLILSNILARPLARMAPQLRSVLMPGGLAVLAGLLTRQERTVINAHRVQGLSLAGRVRLGSWTILIVERPW